MAETQGTREGGTVTGEDFAIYATLAVTGDKLQIIPADQEVLLVMQIHSSKQVKCRWVYSVFGNDFYQRKFTGPGIDGILDWPVFNKHFLEIESMEDACSVSVLGIKRK